MSDDIDLTSGDDLTPFPVLDGPTEVSRRKFELWQNCSENTLLWDIRLVSADGRRFPASRLELASWSEYFCKIFQGGCYLLCCLKWFQPDPRLPPLKCKVAPLQVIMQRPIKQC